MPHLLIAGTTGSGKSVCINTIILSFFEHAPDKYKFILIDPKMLSYQRTKEFLTCYVLLLLRQKN